MSTRKFKVGMAAVLILGIATLFVVVGYAQSSETLNCPSGQLGIFDVEEGVNVECVNAFFATLTPVVGPTDTPTSPTDTPEPGHDDRAWHPVSEEISHEHKANPHDLDGVFGTQVYAWAGGEISHPWQTYMGAGPGYPTPPPPGQFENDFKHEGYGWIAESGIGITDNTSGEYEITDVRVEIHSIQAGVGMLARFHSFWAEARVCRLSDGECGILRSGGWGDFGFMNFNDVHIPLPNDPSPSFLGTNSARRSHDDNVGIWYSYPSEFGHAKVGYAFQNNDIWVDIDPDDVLNSPFVCPDFQCGFNNSTIRLAFFKTNVKANSTIDPDGDGLADFSGYTDRYGNIVSGCSSGALDCVPFELVNYPVDSFSLAFRTATPLREYDVSPPGEFWIEYPN